MRDLLPCPPCGRQGRPGEGSWQAPYHEPRGSAPRERDHRGGDHPVPSRTRQLSPPSPRVLQRKAAGGQGVALAEGAFRFARFRARGDVRRRAACAGRGPRGDRPCGLFAFPGPDRVGSCAFAASSAAHRRRALAASPGKPSKGPCARGLGRRRRMRDIRRSRCRGPARRGVPAGWSFVRALRACSVLRCMCSV